MDKKRRRKTNERVIGWGVLLKLKERGRNNACVGRGSGDETAWDEQGWSATAVGVEGGGGEKAVEGGDGE